MEKKGIVKRVLAVVMLVIAVIGLTMALPGMSVFAEALQPEGQEETTESQSESQEETSGEDEFEEQTETDETELSEIPTEPEEEQSVSQNDISEKEAEEQEETIELLADESTLADDEIELTSAILKKCIVKGTNPSGVTVNLFDYSQGRASDGSTEVAHDYSYQEEWDEALQDYAKKGVVTTYNLGISAGHLLRFGYRDREGNCEYCKNYGYGDWNEYHTNRYHGIVQNKLYNGFPRLNLSEVTEVGEYSGDYLTKNKRTESLAYLFSPDSTAYKEAYSAVQGLFRQDADGYYYYDSQLNFASFNKGTNAFDLYNSPAVAKQIGSNIYYGQFFPFNKARDVFDAAYIDENSIMRLTYNNTAELDDGDKWGNENNYAPITAGGQSYIKCYAPTLNHYLGLTLEMRFVQPVGGCVAGSTDESDEMIFSFSGDDDVWIFIDGVLVADLGGLHDALDLTINFATGEVWVAGESHTLYDSFEAVYGEGSIPSGIFSDENDRTFADNSTHTLKMFYLERGHMASNLSLSFNIQPLPGSPGENEDPDDDDNEDEEAFDLGTDTDASENEVVEISVSDNTLLDSTEIPKTGDDSLIGWWAALCILSLVGIGATVCNLMIRKRRRDKQA